MTILPFLLLLLSSGPRGEAYRYDGPFDLQVTQVRSIAPEQKVGPFSKSLPVYAVNAQSPHMGYLLYCSNAAPEAGRTYKSLEDFVSGNYSVFHLWPVGRTSVPIADLPKKGDKTLFRVVIIQDVASGKPDVACDVKTETPIKM